MSLGLAVPDVAVSLECLKYHIAQFWKRAKIVQLDQNDNYEIRKRSIRPCGISRRSIKRIRWDSLESVTVLYCYNTNRWLVGDR